MDTMLAWWVGFNVGLVVLLLLDLLVFNKKAHAVSMKEALGWSIFWVSLAMVFTAGIWSGWATGTATEGPGERGMQFFTAYLVEMSLSLDNLFVFAVLFRYFQVNPAHQHRVLFWGILGAVILRAVMILGGLALLQHFEWILYVFGLVLLWSGWKLWSAHGGGESPDKNPILRLVRRVVPVTDHFHGERFFLREGGKLLATPLFAVLVAVESTDVMFALDSVPAVLAVTRDPFLAYTSNMFAILGLRALYFLLAGVMGKFWLLHYGLAVLLVFIGAKMLLAHYWEITPAASLAVIGALIGGSIAGSLLIKEPQKHTP